MPTPANEQRKGYQTTEFWLTVLSQFIGMAYVSGLVGDGGTLDKILGFAAAALTALGYSVARGLAKSGAPK